MLKILSEQNFIFQQKTHQSKMTQKKNSPFFFDFQFVRFPLPLSSLPSQKVFFFFALRKIILFFLFFIFSLLALVI